MTINLSEEEVQEILRSWFRLKTPSLADAEIKVHQQYYEGSLAVGIEVTVPPPTA